MSLCINPHCSKPSDPLNANNVICRNCGSDLLLQKRYRVIRLLSDDSGFGIIYEVDDQGIPKILKVLKAHLSSQPKAVELFQQEAQVLMQLKHPGIPKVDAEGYFTFLPRDSSQPLHCLVMERIDGLNLEDWMGDRNYQPISEEQAIDWLKQITQILAQVHARDWFHRDIKPPNIMIRTPQPPFVRGAILPQPPLQKGAILPTEQLVLIDFGTAREITGTYLAKVSGGKNVTGIITPGYTPLEQSNGKAVPQSDFFALGRTFVYLLTGKSPNDFPEDPHTGTLIWRNDASHISNKLADLIDYLIAPFPGNRPQNTQIILQQLTNIDNELSAPKSPQPISNPRPISVTVASSKTNSNKFTTKVLISLSATWAIIFVGTIVIKLKFDQFSQPTYTTPQPQNYKVSTTSQSTTQLQTTKADFNNLEQLLAAEKWEEADQETWELMQKVTNSETRGYLLEEDYKNFPREELRIIDQLWVKYSNGRFGFSVQKQIWIDSGGTLGVYDDDVYQKFGDKVGWRTENSWLSYSDLTFNTTAPPGHLPAERKNGRFGYLFSLL